MGEFEYYVQVAVCVWQLQSERSLCGEEPLGPRIQDLMEHIWQEATGELDEVLASPIASIKHEQVGGTHLLYLYDQKMYI